MRMPLVTSMNASFCGVVTMTAALKPTVCAHAGKRYQQVTPLSSSPLGCM